VRFLLSENLCDQVEDTGVDESVTLRWNIKKKGWQVEDRINL
jgi:hypothetical protein